MPTAEQRIADLERQLERQALGVDIDSIKARVVAARERFAKANAEVPRLVAERDEAYRNAAALADVAKEADSRAVSMRHVIDAAQRERAEALDAQAKAENELRQVERSIAAHRATLTGPEAA